MKKLRLGQGNALSKVAKQINSKTGNKTVDSFCVFLLFFWILFCLCFFIQQVLVGCLFYTYWCVCVGPGLPFHHTTTHPPPLPRFPPWCPCVCSLHLCLYFCPANQTVDSLMIVLIYQVPGSVLTHHSPQKPPNRGLRPGGLNQACASEPLRGFFKLHMPGSWSYLFWISAPCDSGVHFLITSKNAAGPV